MSRKTLMLAAIVAGTLLGSGAGASFLVRGEAARTDAWSSFQLGHADDAHYAQRHPPEPSTLTGKPGISGRDSDQIIL